MICIGVLGEQRILYLEEQSNMFLQNADTSLPNYVHGITFQEAVILNLSQLLEFSVEVWSIR
jgi:hypothetical protein